MQVLYKLGSNSATIQVGSFLVKTLLYKSEVLIELQEIHTKKMFNLKAHFVFLPIPGVMLYRSIELGKIYLKHKNSNISTEFCYC